MSFWYGKSLWKLQPHNNVMIRNTISHTSQEYIQRINLKNNNERTPLKSIKNSEQKWTKLLPKKKMNKTLTNSRSIFVDNSPSDSILCFCTSCYSPSLSWHAQWRVTLIMSILTVRFSCIINILKSPRSLPSFSLQSLEIL